MFSEQIILSINNPIPSNHQVYGEKILPGLAYIDIIYQVFQKHDYSYKEHELRNLSIYHPLKVGQNFSVMLTVSCSEINVNQWMIQIEGCQNRNGVLEDDKKLYVNAEMHRINPVVFNETLDFSSMLNPKNEILNMEKIYGQYKEQGLIHTGLMKAEGNVYNGEAATYIVLSLGQNISPFIEEFMFNPVLIDGSGIGAKNLLSAMYEEEQRLFLPLFYESFKASELMQKQCITRIKRSSIQRKGELLFLDMVFFNESGKKIAELNKCASKLVRAKELITSNKIKSVITETQSELASSLPYIETPIIHTQNITQRDLADFFKELLAEKLNKPKDEIEDDVGYYEMGLNSPDLLDLVKKIEEKLEINLSPTLLFEYTNIKTLASYIERNNTVLGVQLKATLNQKIEPKVTGAKIVSQNVIPSDIVLDKIVDMQQSSLMKVQNDDGDPIAIIGMAGRYPKANNIMEFWDNLKKGKDCISEIPKTRWDWHDFVGVRSLSGREISKWGGFIDDPDCFDPKFFRISPQEAKVMDPQERIFLETCWETIEDAGYTPKTLVQPRGSNGRHYVGVFVGAMHKDYALIGSDLISKKKVFPISLSCAPIANRISYTFNFHGPSMTIDTLCASSLTAVHLAIESIRSRECDVAVAGGVNLSLHPNKYLIYGIRDMHSSDGYCHTFGNGGDGYVSAEGIGAVLLKPLNKAIEDGDSVYAVIKGSFINHGGSGSGMTVPNQTAIAEMVEMCMDKTSINPRTISYMECHGTGTLLGDPIEIQGLDKAFKKYTQDRGFCAIGSVKSNIGHTESAAGIIGLHKVALQLYHKELVPSLHSEESNPHINFEQTPFYVQNKYEEWKEPYITENGEKIKFLRRAGITCIGASGSNAHVILEEFNSLQIPTKEYFPCNKSNENETVIIPFSAKNKKSLHEYARKLYMFLVNSNEKNTITDVERRINSSSPEINLYDLSYTLQVGREAMKDRVAFIVKDVSELIINLKSFIEKSENIKNLYIGDAGHEKNCSESGEEQVSKELIDKWIMEKKVQEIAQLWVKGYSINWEKFYGEVRPHRIHLPSYPFDREHFWITDNNFTSERNDNLLLDKEESHSDLEQKIKKVWEDALELKEIDVNDDFMEMGGNSLIAIKIEVELGNNGIYIKYSDIYTHSSVAKLTSFILQGNGGLYAAKVLDNIEPFNYLYYRHCFYNALFPAIKYYEKDIMPILTNDIAIFELTVLKDFKQLNIRYKSNETIEQLLRKQGITCNTKIASDSIVNDIIFSISNNNPVIIAIDCFYSPIREDLFQKIHWVHYWFIYGYDTVKKEFHIVEHRHRGSLTYKKYVVTFQDLINAYNGALSALNDNEMSGYFIADYWECSKIPTYFEFSCDTSPFESNLDTYKKIFAEGMISSQESIFSGLKQIQAFEEFFKDIVLNEEVLRENVNKFINMINSIINAHKAEIYKTNLLFTDAEDIVVLLNKVVDAWEFIRVKLSRYAYTMVYNIKSLHSTVDKFMQVYNFEKEFYEKYISFLRTFEDKN